jgi:biotin transporter BioY
MNSVQMHLALTHVPVILSLVGLIMLIVAFFIKNTTLTKTSYILFLVAGVAALPVFFSGEGTEEAIENLPGVSDAIIERHEEVANLAMISIAAAGLLALAGLFTFKWQIAARMFKTVVLILAIAAGGLMAQTAHLGGQIRHTEIRNGVAFQTANDAGGENESNGNNQREKEDD